jgi:formylglycine-generating enzyme required for sulfatase activity
VTDDSAKGQGPGDVTRWDDPLQERGSDDADATRLGDPTHADPTQGEQGFWPTVSETTAGDSTAPAADQTYMSGEDAPGAVDPDATFWSADGPAPAAFGAKHTPKPGAVIGPYVLQELLGQGGMGAVYRAWEERAKRQVALKVITGTLSQRARERFLREGQVAARFQHPGIVDVHEVGEHHGMPFLACELVPQLRSFRDELRYASLEHKVIRIRDAALALGHAHEHKIVHRDVKPDNLLLNADGRVQVADFGLVHAEDLDALTKTGTFLGTPAYAPPEQGQREKLGAPTDVWSLGVILYEAMTGTRPFVGRSSVDLRYKIVSTEPAGPRSLDPNLPEPLERICLQALRKDPATRYANGSALAADLQRYLDDEEVLATATRRRPLRLIAGVLALGLIARGRAVGARSRDTTSSAVVGAPTLVLDRLPARISDEFLVLRGEVKASSRCVINTPRTEPRRVSPGPFKLRVPIEPGENSFVVTIRDADGRSPPARRVAVTRVPKWFLAFPPEQLPALPLPAGMQMGAESNEYVWRRHGLALSMAWVPPSTFRFGPDSDTRKATITRGYWIGRHEITWGQLNGYLATKPQVVSLGPQAYTARVEEQGLEELTIELKTPIPAPDENAACGISWTDAQRFCQWLGLRLPTEAEWELAAQGPRQRRFPWGDHELEPREFNSRNADPYPYTSPPGAFPSDRSPYGCMDMAGNVQEWVFDPWGPLPDAGPLIDYRGPPSIAETSTLRVLRGGSWKHRYLRTFETDYRFPKDWGIWYINVGFRVCLNRPRVG